MEKEIALYGVQETQVFIRSLPGAHFTGHY